MDSENSIEELYLIIQQTFRILHQQSGMSPVARAATILQRATLNYLREHREATMGDMSQSLHMSLSSSTQLVARLVRAGFVSRRDDTSDRRVVRIRITKTGERELVRLANLRREKITRLLSLVPERDIKELVRIHKTILFRLQTQTKGAELA